MYCNQCEQAYQGSACNSGPGICGKDENVQSLQEMLLYGVKGLCAYAHHARRLGYSDPVVDEFVERALFSTMTNVNFSLEEGLALCLECGEKNLRVMELLDQAHVETFGQPEPTQVLEGTVAGPGIVVTGHDLLMLADVLKACEGTAVRVYTHGEMLPAHMYPKLKNHPNLEGHYGGAWQKQRNEFQVFPGAIIANTNCIQIPKPSYAGRFFTVPPVSAPGATAIRDNNFAPLVQAALAAEPCRAQQRKSSTIGFHRSVILSKAGAIVDAVKAGKISRFFVIGGCDGAEPGRNYFADYAAACPQDSFILTLGCGKYRIREHDYGTLLGLPRLLDMGQCNDAFGAISVAVALAKAFNCGVNDLPLTLVISWFEQKAVAVLLTLLHLNVKGIAIGPNPPPWVSPAVFQVLQERWDLRLIGQEAAADCALACGA